MPIFNYSGGSTDAWGETPAGVFDDTGTFLYICASNTKECKTWIPFAITDIPKNTIITNAYVTWIAAETRTDTIDIAIGAENSGNAVAPTTNAILQAKTSTATLHYYTISNYTVGNSYSYTCTTAVQEFINHASYAQGNTLGLMVFNPFGSTQRHRIASYENTTYNQPIITIETGGFVPLFLEG